MEENWKKVDGVRKILFLKIVKQLIQNYDFDDGENDDDGGNWKRLERKKGKEEIGGWQEGKLGLGNSSIFPFLLDVEVPFPGQVVMLVVVSELGFNVVSAAGQQAFGCLL